MKWDYIKDRYPHKHLFGRLYLVRVWMYSAKKISPWVLFIVPKE